MAGGAAFGAASACGGALVAAGPALLARVPGAHLPTHLTFAASLAARVAAAGASLAIIDGAAAARVRGWSVFRAWPAALVVAPARVLVAAGEELRRRL
jgi:hypothetical protein